MKNTTLYLKAFLADESGQDLIEYALVAAVVGLGAVSALSSLASAVQAGFNSVASAITTAV
jgi:pilus assembly protein Flp/PilA